MNGLQGLWLSDIVLQALPFETWRPEQKLTDSRVGSAWGRITGCSGVNQPVRPVWLVVMLLCECLASWLLTLPLIYRPYCPEATQMNVHTHAYAQDISIHTHTIQMMYSFACIWPGVNKTCPGAHLSKCVIYGTQGPFRGIQSKYALHTIWNILSSHSPPRYAFEAKNHRHFFRSCQNVNAALQVME